MCRLASSTVWTTFMDTHLFAERRIKFSKPDFD